MMGCRSRTRAASSTTSSWSASTSSSIPHSGSAAVAETVNAAKLLKGSSLRGLINGVLRNFQRSAEVILLRIDRVPSASASAIPNGFTKRLRQAYPDDWGFIMEANNQRPPMWIR